MIPDTKKVRAQGAWISALRSCIEIKGPDSTKYLQGQLSQDIEAIPTGASAPSLLLSPQGKLVAWVGVTRLGQERYMIDVHSDWSDETHARLIRFLLRTDCEIVQRELTCITTFGPASASALSASSELVNKTDSGLEFQREQQWAGLSVVHNFAKTSTIGELQSALGLSQTRPLDTATVDSLRVEAGIAEMGAELDETTIPATAGLVEQSASFSKGCYVGQELVEKIDAKGKEMPKRLVGLVPVEKDLETKLVPGLPLQSDGRAAVTITTSGTSTVLGTAIAMGYANRRTPDGTIVTDPYLGTEITVCALPLIKEKADA